MDPLSPHTLVLTERVPALARLAASTADFLLAGWRHVVSLRPTRRRHVYRLTPLGHVGVLPAPGARLVIRPKIPLKNIFMMLDPNASLPETEDASEAEPAGPVFDFLAGQYARRMVERSAVGLHRGYVEANEVGPFLRGRLALSEQLTERQPSRLHSLRDDFSSDIPCNQAVAATAEQLLRLPLLGPNTLLALRQALAGYTDVRPVATAGQLQAPEEYRTLLELRQLLEDALRPGESAGEVAAPAFLLDLGRVFERYVASGVRAELGENVRVQPTFCSSGAGGIEIRPDLVVERGGRASVVVDTKWKRLPAKPADLYQAIAYATALRVRRSLLIYPADRDSVRGFSVGPVQLEVRTMNVSGTVDDCRRSLQRLCRSVAGRL
jgi:5-methylcytosine-specific restriction enzyme subunit McrC